MEENYKLIQALEKKQKNFKVLKQIVFSIRNNNLKMADATLEYGIQLVRKYRSKLGDEYYLVLEELFNASLDCQIHLIGNKAWKQLSEQFPNSEKVKRMRGILMESTEQTEQFEPYYEQNINENLLDTETRKRQLANLRSDNNINQFVTEMNNYLETNPNDGEAWMELGDLYLEYLNYQKALHCFEELLLLFPKKFIYMVTVAEIFYSLGGLQNLQTAKNYYCYVLNKDPKCYRALWGLLQTCKRLSQLNKKSANEKNQELYELTALAIKNNYAEMGQKQLIANFPFQKSNESE